MRDLSQHPCFHSDAKRRFGRIHLPVAPHCNMQCNFCNRKFDCVNERHPGVTSDVLTPSQAITYLADAVARHPELAVVGFAGPGDPFANAAETLSTMRRVREEFPAMLLCVATNGLAIGPHIEALARLDVRHVTLTVNAVDPAIGARIYAWIRDGKRPLRGVEGAALLWARQREAIVRLKAHGITVKINSILISGINAHHLPVVAETVAELGADVFNCMPMVQVPGAEFAALRTPDPEQARAVRAQCGAHLPLMPHCARCRADAVGLVGAAEHSPELRQWMTAKKESAEALRPYVAVASYEGALINQHLGETDRFRIYGKQSEAADEFVFREFRKAPDRGSGDARWHALADLLCDCRAILVASAGPQPQRILSTCGLSIVEMEGLIEEGLAMVYSGREIPQVLPRRWMRRPKEKECRGTGMGCG